MASRIPGSKDGIGHPAPDLTHWFGYLGKESEIERTGALEEEIAEDGNQRRHDQDGAAHGSDRRQVVATLRAKTDWKLRARSGGGMTWWKPFAKSL